MKRQKFKNYDYCIKSNSKKITLNSLQLQLGVLDR